MDDRSVRPATGHAVAAPPSSNDEVAPLEIEHCGFPPRDSLAQSCPSADEG
jgi:hypothetical protein